MGNFFKALKQGVGALGEGLEPSKFEVTGKSVKCPHCGNETFAEGQALLNTAGMTFFKLAWANKTASTLMCADCGHIEWFGQKPTRV